MISPYAHLLTPRKGTYLGNFIHVIRLYFATKECKNVQSHRATQNATKSKEVFFLSFWVLSMH